jgi:spore coat-associated protein N
MRIASRSTAVKIFASVVLVGGAASVAGLGTFGGFTSTTNASQEVGTGKVVLTSGAGVQGMVLPVTNIVPGDALQRTITLTRSSDTQSFGSVKLTTTGSTTNVLTSDASNGLQLTVDQCSVAWAKVGSTSALSCSGTTTQVIAQRAILGTAVDLGAATTALNGAGAVSNLRATISLPDAAGNTFQALSNTLTFTFDATQRAANTAL